MWYSSGTVTATNNSNIVTGVSTQFIANVRVGDGITIQGSSALHEVINIASNTQLTIKPNYIGTTGGGKQFACAPLLGYDKDLSDAFNQLRLQFGDKLSNLKPWAYAATASAALDSLGFSASGKSVATGTPEKGRAGLGLGTAATRNIGTNAGEVMGVGAYGLGAIALTADFKSTGGVNRFFSGYIDPELTGIRCGVTLAYNQDWWTQLISRPVAVPELLVRSFYGGTSYSTAFALSHSGNLLTTTGQSTRFPMTQKATTDAINGVSDMRDKTDSQEFGIGLELIEELDVIKYKLNKRDWYRAQEAKKTKTVTRTDEDGNETTEEVEEIDAEILDKPLTDYDANDGSLARGDYYTGMSAQAVKAKLDGLGMSNIGLVKKYDEEYEGGEDRYYIEQLGLLPFLINSVKQLSEQNKALVERVELLEGEL